MNQVSGLLFVGVLSTYQQEADLFLGRAQAPWFKVYNKLIVIHYTAYTGKLQLKEIS